jgi:hypothetical protein
MKEEEVKEKGEIILRNHLQRCFTNVVKEFSDIKHKPKEEAIDLHAYPVVSGSLLRLPIVDLITSNFQSAGWRTHIKAMLRTNIYRLYLNEFILMFKNRRSRGPVCLRARALAINVNGWAGYQTLYGGELIHRNPEEREPESTG